MRSKYLIFLLQWTVFTASGQIWDDFSDGEIHQNPEWSGDTGNFVVTSEACLQIQAAGSGTSFIYTAFTGDWANEEGEREWRTGIRLTFSPSASNWYRWYLWRSAPNKESLEYEAVYIQVGENGSADGIDLFHENAAGQTKLIDGPPGTMISTDNQAFILVRYHEDGTWTLLASFGASEWLAYQGNCQKQIDFYQGIMALECTYTSSNATRFYIDEVYAGPPQDDTLKPAITRISLQLPLHLMLEFSEIMDSSSLQNLANYELFESENYISGLKYQASLPRQVLLECADSLHSGDSYSLYVSQLLDTSGNFIKDTILPVRWYQPVFGDVLVTEFMADPSPPVGLPDCEYLELHNRSPVPINLESWVLWLGTKNYKLPSNQLLSGHYLILVSPGNCAAFGNFTPCLELPSSLSLTNSGAEFQLRDSLGTLIHAGEYASDWHAGSWEEAGGYSLEMIDTYNPCGGKSNWTSSRHEAGGTPGSRNSVSAVNPDENPPQLERAYWIDSLNVGLLFSEPVLLEEYDAGQLQIDGEEIAALTAVGMIPNHYLLRSATILAEHEKHSITASHIPDCAANEIQYHPVYFQKPIRASPGDVCINEVLFNPLGDGVDYVELLNCSEQVVDVHELLLAGYQAESMQYEDIHELTTIPFLLFPGGYLIITSNPEQVMSTYVSHDAEAFLTPAVSLPGMSNDSGRVALLNRNMQLIDRIYYRESMHYLMLRSFEGVALEKVHPSLSGELTSSWFSASESVGFGTPGLANSQYWNNASDTIPFPDSSLVKKGDYFLLEHPSFSPNMDGYRDVLHISYAFPEAGYLLKAEIYGYSGQKLRTLLVGEFVSVSGQFYWDGLDEAGKDLPVGLYFIRLEYYHPSGDRGHQRLDCVLVTPD